MSSAIAGYAKMALLWAQKASDISLHCMPTMQHQLDLDIIAQLAKAVKKDKKPFLFDQIRWPGSNMTNWMTVVGLSNISEK